MAAGSKGLITRIMGPVVDVTFKAAGDVPEIYNALKVRVARLP